MDIFQDIATMAGQLTTADPGEQGVQPLLVAGAKIGIVGGVAGDTGAALATVDAFVWGLQWA